MARKQLIKGSNAKRLEDEIKKAPEDLKENTNIFTKLKKEYGKIEETDADELPEISPQIQKMIEKSEDDERKKQEQKKIRELKEKIQTAEKEKKKNLIDDVKKLEKSITNLINKEQTKHERKEETDQRITDEQKNVIKEKRQATPVLTLNSKEKKILIVSLRNYRNSLPIYLKSEQEKVRTIDSVINKLGGEL